MKAAIEAWGAPANQFHQGLAQESDDPEIVAATMEKPGTVLRRAVGTSDPFRERASLPPSLPRDAPPARRTPKAPVKKHKPASDPKAQKAAVIQFEKAKAEREARRRQEEAEQAAEERQGQRRQQAVTKAEAILERARERHEEKLARLEDAVRDAEARVSEERARWRDEERMLERKIREAGA